ncbi:AAA family ATPase [Marinithermus hydrothermalis]|uniref:Chromosome partition protein Smc n=1 Tax=Marinithermus hydrothermalis (strain DSM 14884 / JCM 11576 / T1) TaxID=869210 RepID=F2NQL7_MARHT|nr:chromosome segregation SMC family protein [Marinithermus hydrothermalis]AEB11955.1 SMC domain protein [Marinithermus hydrothermalis DSM 14884]
MRIERLILHGFKSFAERTVLEFPHGLSGIIGPNGSGKSNVIEALRFVVGARARELRGGRAEELIFHGGTGRPPMPFAEVILELTRGRERITVSRRIERDGSQEVRLNGRRASFRQIEQALAGSGLGRNGYAIVGQGEVSGILHASPEVLLGHLEDAAGLRTVTLAHREAQARLERAEAHLAELSSELARRQTDLERLAEEARAAQRAQALAAERLCVQRGLIQARVAELEREIQALRAAIQAAQDTQAELRERQTELKTARAQAEAALEAALAHQAELKAAYEARRGEVRLLEARREHLQRERRRLLAERARLEQELERLRRQAPPELPERPEGDPNTLAEAVAHVRDELAEAEAALTDAETTYRQATEEYARYQKALAVHEAQRAARAQALQERARLEADRARLTEAYARLQAELEAKETQARKLRAALNEASRALSETTSELRALTREKERLAAFVASGADLAEGPRRVAQSGIPGVIGVVADLVRAPEGLEAALEAALGGRLQWVLTEDEAAAKTAVAYLKRHGGRATFLPRTLLRPRTRSWSALARAPGVLGFARDLAPIPGEPEATAVLFGDTLVIQDLEAALAIARAHPDRPRLVTLEGEVLEASGALTGGRARKGAGQTLALRRRLADLEAEVAAHEAEVRALQDTIARTKADLAALEVEQSRARAEELARELKALERALAHTTLPEVPPAPEPVPEPDPRPLEALRERVAALKDEAGRLEAAAARWEAYRREAAHYRALLERFEADQARAQEAMARLETLRAELEQLEAEHAQLAADLDRARQAVDELDLEAAARRVQAQRQEVERLLAEEEATVRRLSETLTQADEHRLTLARREATLEAVRAEAAALPPGEAAEGTYRTLQRRLAQIEREISEMGPVNHRAEHAHAQLAAEVERLKAEVAEAAEAARQLEAGLEAVQREYADRLEAAFQRFQERFAHYAHALLGGGATVQREAGGLALGLNPAGKRTRRLELLSMGEKTMGALAFLFALAEVGEGGLPLAVLDEVDAPLDEANIARFTRFLRRFSTERQFILVTHQKRTMEACDALYGVTSRDGMSRVYTIRREEAPLGVE